jgi:hypothetical protein
MSKSAIDVARLQSLIAELYIEESEEAIRAVAGVFVAKAAGTRQPLKSIAKTIPAHLAGRVHAELCERIRQAAYEAAEGLSKSDGGNVGEWLPLSRVAEMFKTREDILRVELRQRDFRRQCGWPRHFLGDWWLPAAAFDARAAHYFANLPEQEPYDPPADCERLPYPSKEHPGSISQPGERP